MNNIVTPDLARSSRIGIEEAVLCDSKSDSDLLYIVEKNIEEGQSALLTRLSKSSINKFPQTVRDKIDYDWTSRTGFLGPIHEVKGKPLVAIVTAGTSDNGVAREAARTLRYAGEKSISLDDLGVAGLWRILEKEPELRTFPIVIVVAGMDGALFGVVGGLIPSSVIAVPTSVGYGASRGGETALAVALANCAPGILVVNIDNGYGAACAALRVLNNIRAG